jgi:excisionase family DNA binding protein
MLGAMNASAIVDPKAVVVPTEATRRNADAVEATILRYLRDKHASRKSLKLLSADGEICDLPSQMVDLLAQMAAILARGDAVAVNALSRELSTTEAATLLGMSRPTFIRLLDQGELPYRMVGSHRRVDLKQVLDLRWRRLEQQRQKYAELMRESDALGMTE